MQQASFLCPQCQQVKLFTRQTMNHTPHILASVFLCGLWLPIWVILAMSDNSQFHCSQCGYSDSTTRLLNPKLCPGCRRVNNHSAVKCFACSTFFPNEIAKNDFTSVNYNDDDKPSYPHPAGKILGAVVVVGLIAMVSFIIWDTNIKRAVKSEEIKKETQSSPTPFQARISKPFDAELKGNKSATVISTTLNIRKNPETTSEVLDIIGKDSVVLVKKQNRVWFLVRTDRGEGWVHGDTIKINPR